MQRCCIFELTTTLVILSCHEEERKRRLTSNKHFNSVISNKSQLKIFYTLNNIYSLIHIFHH